MRLFFHQLGQGEPLILLHGLFGMSDNLMPLARELSEDYSVYVPDLRNQGRSPHSDEMDFATMATDVALMMDEQGLKQAHVLGHSLGGKVAMALASRYPQRVKSLVVADIAPVSYPAYHEQLIKGLYTVRLAQPTNRREADAVLAEFVEDESVRRFLLKNLVKNDTDKLDWQFNLDGIANAYHRLREGVAMKQPFSGATLFIKGELSDYITSEHEVVIRAGFPNFQFKMIQNAGHWLHAEKPAAFVKVVRKFLQEQSFPVALETESA